MNSFALPAGIPFDNPVIRFYALCILCGALVALFLSDYHAHKDGYDWHFFDTIFFIAFPSGILGARVWYVIANWHEFASLPWYKVFAIWEGGLAIQGGIIGGVLIGVIACLIRRKGTSILKIMDFAVPTIFVAQAMGRWGNFFNQEVYGHMVMNEAWSFLPAFITENMEVGSTDAVAAPLFLVEGGVNLLFYFILVLLVPALEKKKYANGDQAFLYFSAYGIIRMILEPLRNAKYIMGDITVGDTGSYKSYIMAIVFIVFGIVMVIINHVLRYLSEKGKMEKVPFVRDLYFEKSMQVITYQEQKEEREDISNKLQQMEQESSASSADDFSAALRGLENQDEEKK